MDRAVAATCAGEDGLVDAEAQVMRERRYIAKSVAMTNSSARHALNPIAKTEP